MTVDLNMPLNDPEKTCSFGQLALQESKTIVDYVYNSGIIRRSRMLTKIFDNGDRLSLRGEANPIAAAIEFRSARVSAVAPLPFAAAQFLRRRPNRRAGWTERYNAALRYEHSFNEDWSATLVVDYYRSFSSYGWLTNWTYDGLSDISFGHGARTLRLDEEL